MRASRSSPQHTLPDHPNLRYLKDEAWRLLKSGGASTLADAQFQIARLFGFTSWPRLKDHVDSLTDIDKLKSAIDANDGNAVKALMKRNPALHRAPLGYGKSGPLTWVAECRIPPEPPGPTRLDMAQWMIDHGSDVHQGGDGPLMRAALDHNRIPMADLLVQNGADVNARWNGHFPIIFAPCETVDPLALKWLLDHGADPNLPLRHGADSALDYVIGTYVRSAQLVHCIDLLIDAGSSSRRNLPVVLELLRGRLDRVASLIENDPSLVHQRFDGLDFGSTAGRRLTLRGATLLHVAAEYGNRQAAALLIERGAAVNATAELDSDGIGGQSPVFHAVSQGNDFGLPVAKYLIDCGAKLGITARLPGHYERPEEFVECTPLQYALLFPGQENKTVAFLRSIGAPA